jgi:uncharacterized membrane protein YedE/YeeE
MDVATRTPAPPSESEPVEEGALGLRGLALYLALGTLFGFVLTRGEVISWFRIQEMFRFQGFHMYGVFAGALAVAIPSMALLRTGRFRTLSGGTIVIPAKEHTPLQTRYWAGGSLFGVGWAFTGACPGPLFALLGSGIPVFIVPIVGAVGGTWLYGYFRSRLPH